jgi:sugar lactone lactonase YvrE
MPHYRLFGRLIIACLALPGLMFTVTGPVAAAYKLTPREQKELMPLKEVRSGMRGYGLTVFRGTKIEKFAVTVVDVLPKINSGKSLILVRMQGGPITARHANIIEGMSGSPIYVNGRMIGAVSYGAMFPREPLAMVTPIEDMLDAWDPDLPAKPAGSMAMSTSLDHPVTIGGHSVSRVIMQEPGASTFTRQSGALVIVPLVSPLRVSGMSNRGIERLRGILDPYGVAVAPGPGPMSAKNKPKITLQPGSSVGISIASGDIDISGVGTLTYRRGNKVVAFGHPSLGQPLGPIDAPMTTAYVHDVMPGLMTSMKLASPIETVGRISQDGQFSIGGLVGSMPKMIPVTVSVNDTTARRAKTFNVKVINHPLLSPVLISMVASEAITQVRPAPGEAVANVTYEVQADEVGKLRRENVVFDPVSIDGSALDELTETLFALRQNRFHPVAVQSVRMWVNIAEKRNTATVERIFVKDGKYAPGDTIDVGVVLRPYKMDRITKYVKITVPLSTPSGRAVLMVRGGSVPGGPVMSGPQPLDSEGGDGEGGPQPGFSQPDMATADSVKQLIKKLMEREKNNEIVTKLILSSSAINVAGEKLSFLPSNIADVMKSSRSTASRMEREEVKVVQATDYVLGGMQALPITIQKKDLSEKRTAPKSVDPTESSSDEPSSSSSGGTSASSMSSMDDGDFYPGSVDIDPASDILNPQATAPRIPPSALLLRARQIMQARAAAQAQKSESGTVSPTPVTPTVRDEKPIGRAATTWTQTLQADFNAGLLTGVTSTSANDLRVSPLLRQAATDADSYLWSMVPDGAGGVYAGSGNSGIVYRMTADGKLSVIYDSPELEILSLARDSAGNLYAGTSPHGLVYRISSDGKAAQLFDAEEEHIAALLVDVSANVYAATGDKSKVYKIAPDGTAKVIFSSTDQNAQALAMDTGGNLFVGTSPNGLVYKVTPDGSQTALYDASESSINALAVDAKGSVYAATGPKSTVIRIPVSGTPKVVLEKTSSAIMEMTSDASGNILAEAQDRIYKIQPDEVITELDTKDDPVFVSMALDSSGKLFVGTANPGAIYTCESGDSLSGTYQSIAHDTKSTSQWGTISWLAKVPEGSNVAISTRSGNSADPDSSWSPWSAPYSVALGSRVTSPAARYVQYRAEMTTGKNGASPELRNVSIAYMSANQAPTLKVSAPVGGEKWAKKQTIKWSGSDPDKDTLTYDIYYSTDMGLLWRPLTTKKSTPEVKPADKDTIVDKKDSGASSPDADKKDADPDPSDTDVSEGADVSDDDVADVISAIQTTPDLPAGLRDKVAAEAAPDGVATANGDAKEPVAVDTKAAKADDTDNTPKTTSQKSESTKETSYSWDTKTVADGTYVIKVVASDKTSNPAGALATEKLSDPFVIVNKPPRVMLFKKTITVQPDRSVKLEGIAWQKLAAVSNAQYRVDASDWVAIAASDGVFDSAMEPFALTTQPLTKGGHNIEVKVFDSAGNSASQKTPVEVK